MESFVYTYIFSMNMFQVHSRQKDAFEHPGPSIGRDSIFLAMKHRLDVWRMQLNE